MEMLDQCDKFLQETSDMLAKLLKDPSKEKEPNKFWRVANSNGESLERNGEVMEELNTF